MSIWLVRSGSRGERQDFALEQNTVVVGWDEMPDLAQFSTREALITACQIAYPNAKPKTVINWAGQLWTFFKIIQNGDLVVMPLKDQDAIAIGRITGSYQFHPKNSSGTKHTRSVTWLFQDMPRSKFDQDILFSFGAFLTVCQIKRNNAEERIKAILEGKVSPIAMASNVNDESNEENADFEQKALIQIQSFIAQKFAGHKLATLVSAVLEAQGYTVLTSEPGPDGGVDILAGRGDMGFDRPKLCVQVKSGDGQQDAKVLRELKGVMGHYGAEQGLFVSWGGFKRTAKEEFKKQFFDMRLWDAADLTKNILKNYAKLPDDIKAELSLKQVWVLVQEE